MWNNTCVKDTGCVMITDECGLQYLISAIIPIIN